jgi:hypothetical protein
VADRSDAVKRVFEVKPLKAIGDVAHEDCDLVVLPPQMRRELLCAVLAIAVRLICAATGLLTLPSAAAAEVEFTITAAAAGARRGAVEVALLHRALAREVARTAAAKATSRRRARCCRAVAGVVPKLAAGEALHLAVV